MTEPGGIVEQYRDLISIEYIFTAPEEVGPAFIRQFPLAVGDLNPLYVNRQSATALLALPRKQP